MKLDLSSLKKAVSSMENALQVTSEDAIVAFDKRTQEVIRAGVIHNFEVAYEQCWRFIQRWIRENRTPEDADHPRTRKELFRLATRYGLISDPKPWFEFGEARNLTSHTDEDQANTVFETAKRFLPQAKELLERLEKIQ